MKKVKMVPMTSTATRSARMGRWRSGRGRSYTFRTGRQRPGVRGEPEQAVLRRRRHWPGGGIRSR
ncbi:MAG: hypothetical protein P8X95_23165 [Anaerolineales bacterium]